MSARNGSPQPQNTLAALDYQGQPVGVRPENLSLRDLAYRRLKEDIVLGRLAFAAVLSPRKLASEMGMSSLPVGEALRILEAEGLVESRDRVGTRVKVPTVEHIEGVYTLREALESQAARLCCVRASRQQRRLLNSMARQVDDMYARCARDDASDDLWHETTIFHANFHRFITECAGCPMLTAAIENSQVLIFKILFDSTLRRKKRPRDWHRSLVAAILEGDPAAADAAARGHIHYGIAEVLCCVRALQPGNRWRGRPRQGRRPASLV